MLPNQPSNLLTPVVIQDGIAYVSGQLPRENGTLNIKGKVGKDIDLETARQAAVHSINNCLDRLTDAIGPEGTILRILKITGFIASADGFNQQGTVIDAASEVLLERLGERGGHARSAVGVAELPHGAPVEIEMIAAVSG